MKELLLVNLLLLTVVTVSNVYGSGPRLDYDERYEDILGAPECWVDGYDEGFAGKCDQYLIEYEYLPKFLGHLADNKFVFSERFLNL